MPRDLERQLPSSARSVMSSHVCTVFPEVTIDMDCFLLAIVVADIAITRAIFSASSGGAWSCRALV